MDDYDYGYEQGSADIEAMADHYIDQLEKMYTKDIKELQGRLDEMTNDRDLWKSRALEAEAGKAQAQRQLRHI